MSQYISDKIGESLSLYYYKKSQTTFNNGGLFCNIYSHNLAFATSSIVSIVELPYKITDDFELVSYKRYLKSGLNLEFIKFPFQLTIDANLVVLANQVQFEKFANKAIYLIDGWGWYLHRIYSVFIVNLDTKQFAQKYIWLSDNVDKSIGKTLKNEGFVELTIEKIEK